MASTKFILTLFTIYGILFQIAQCMPQGMGRNAGFDGGLTSGGFNARSMGANGFSNGQPMNDGGGLDGGFNGNPMGGRGGTNYPGSGGLAGGSMGGSGSFNGGSVGGNGGYPDSMGGNRGFNGGLIGGNGGYPGSMVGPGFSNGLDFGGFARPFQGGNDLYGGELGFGGYDSDPMGGFYKNRGHSVQVECINGVCNRREQNW